MNCLLLDIGNTHTHLGLGNARRVCKRADMPTAAWFDGSAPRRIAKFLGKRRPTGVALCSVVPRATPHAHKTIRKHWKLPVLELTARTVRGVGIDYPRPATIGPDRLANAVAAYARCGGPVVVVDFGTAVTYDVINRKGDYVGGIIAPGLALMTTYLHEKTALLPEVTIREVAATVGKSTREAMLIGAVKGYRGMIRELVRCLKAELGSNRLPVLATGGYAALITRGMPEITGVDRLLTLEGLRLSWGMSQAEIRRR
jgi:type III pantothenate kinase